jgi:26S proteasome regulatory subunit N7
VLAHKLFLLSHPDVDDLAKVDLRADVLAVVKSDGSGSSYLLLELDSSCG